MPLLNEASNVYLGDRAVDAVYRGDVKVWPTEEGPEKPIYGLDSLGTPALTVDTSNWNGLAATWSGTDLCINIPKGSGSSSAFITFNGSGPYPDPTNIGLDQGLNITQKWTITPSVPNPQVGDNIIFVLYWKSDGYPESNPDYLFQRNWVMVATDWQEQGAQVTQDSPSWYEINGLGVPEGGFSNGTWEIYITSVNFAGIGGEIRIDTKGTRFQGIVGKHATIEYVVAETDAAPVDADAHAAMNPEKAPDTETVQRSTDTTISTLRETFQSINNGRMPRPSALAALARTAGKSMQEVRDFLLVQYPSLTEDYDT